MGPGRAHGPGAGHDLTDRLAAHAHGGDRGGHLGRRWLAAQAGGEEFLGGVFVQRGAVRELGQQGLEGVRHGRRGRG